jgi:hypothetical protein
MTDSVCGGLRSEFSGNIVGIVAKKRKATVVSIEDARLLPELDVGTRL